MRDRREFLVSILVDRHEAAACRRYLRAVNRGRGFATGDREITTDLLRQVIREYELSAKAAKLGKEAAS